MAAVDPENLPAYTGELLGSRIQNVLRGVNSARLYLKRANERAERRLLEVETLGALRTLHTGHRFPASDFRLAWRQLLKCHPHDSICGCSCDEVHRDMLVRYEQLERTVAQLERRALGAFAVDAPGAVGVVNLLPYRRRGLVEVPDREPAVVELDGFSARPVELGPAGGVRRHDGDGTAIENDRFRVEAAPGGTLTMLDKTTGRRFEHLHGLEDEPDIGDLYNFCPAGGAETWRPSSATASVLRDGPVIHELEIRVQTEPLTVATVVRLVDGIDRVEFRTTIDNAATDHRLRVVFPAGPEAEPATTVRAEGQFAVVHRPLAPPPPKTEWLEPPDSTQHTLGAVALGRLALLTKGLPEYEARGDELCLTLLRCVGVISQPTGAISTRPLGAGPGTETPDGQCLGRHELEYALLPGADELDDAELLRAAHDYRYSFLVTPEPVEIHPPISIEGDVVFSCLKGAEDGEGLILRCFNPKAAPASIELAGAFTLSASASTRQGSRQSGREPISSPARSGPSGCDQCGTRMKTARTVPVECSSCCPVTVTTQVEAHELDDVARSGGLAPCPNRTFALVNVYVTGVLVVPVSFLVRVIEPVYVFLPLWVAVQLTSVPEMKWPHRCPRVPAKSDFP